MAKAKKKFDEDFKKMILDLNQSGQSVEELAEQYGIATQTIYRWKKLRDSLAVPKQQSPVPLQLAGRYWRAPQKV